MMPVNFRIRAAPHLDHCRIKDAQLSCDCSIQTAYKSAYGIIKEDIKKKIILVLSQLWMY